MQERLEFLVPHDRLDRVPTMPSFQVHGDVWDGEEGMGDEGCEEPLDRTVSEGEISRRTPDMATPEDLDPEVEAFLQNAEQPMSPRGHRGDGKRLDRHLGQLRREGERHALKDGLEAQIQRRQAKRKSQPPRKAV